MSTGAREQKRIELIRAVVADDEPTAREYLKLILDRVGGVEVVGEAQEAAECLRAVTSATPDVVFLDIHLPDQSGMEVAKALMDLREPPLIVFVTGYDEYAVPAFEVAAVDYIMKPFNQERVEKTLGRIRSRLDQAHTNGGTQALVLGKLAIRDREGAKLVPVEEICYINTRGRKTIVRTATGDHSTSYTLAELEHKLQHFRFFRANEGCLVNLDRVKEVIYDGPRTYELLLTEPKETFIPLSRSRTPKLRELLDF